MELSISDTDASAIGLDSRVKEQIVDLVHRHLGRVSVADVALVDEPAGITLTTASGTILVDRDLTRRIDN